jgi:hypothetical protein
VLNSVSLAPGAFLQTYARVVNQQGVNFLVGAWGDASISGNLAYLKMRELGRDARPGANLKLTQPIMEHLAFTLEGSYNETLTSSAGSGRIVVGLEFGNWVKPKEYAAMTSPVPMDVPRIRYEIGTRRVGNSPPVADAGPDQLGVNAGTITLNGSGSSDPLGLPLTYQWTQISGPTITLNNASGVTATFTAAAGQTYNFRLTVRNSEGLSATDTVTVSTASPTSARITSFVANPASIATGQSTTLSWSIDNATSASITPGPGTVDAHTGSVAVSPTQTTTYTLTATGPTGQVTQQVTVTVGSGAGPQVLRFEASPLNIQPGQSSTLSWTTNGGSSVTIDNGIGTVAANGSTSVSPNATTKYTLTVTSADGRSVTSPITITVTPAGIPQIQTFVASPPTIDAGGSTRLCWQVSGATDISITPGVGSNLSANDCASVSPTQTTTYTLTAKNASGQIQANATVSVGQIRILSFTSDPIFSPISGGPVTLTWKTDNALSVVIIGNDFPPQTLPTSGSVVIHPISSATYTLTAYGAGGQTVSTTISVFVR